MNALLVTITKRDEFTFNQLSKEAKDAVRNFFAPDYRWWDDIYAEMAEVGKQLGFQIGTEHHSHRSHFEYSIHFSGFYCQGDGASWEGHIVIREWLENYKPDDARAFIVSALIENGWIEPYLKVGKRHSYNHEGSMCIAEGSIDSLRHYAEEDARVLDKGMFEGASVENLFDVVDEQYVCELEQEMLESARSFARTIYERLRDEYEHMQSDEYLTELCEANEYLFDENGKLL